MKDLSKPQKDKDIATVEYVLANGSGTDLLPTDLMTKPTKIFTEVLFDNATGIINTKYLNDVGVIVSNTLNLPNVFASKAIVDTAISELNVDLNNLETKVNNTVNTNINNINKEITQIKQDIGGYALRLQNQNKKLETML